MRGNLNGAAGQVFINGEVYPRACGGTSDHHDTGIETARYGLSPRVRGNRQNTLRTRLQYWLSVYPRACGGTSSE